MNKKLFIGGRVWLFVTILCLSLSSVPGSEVPRLTGLVEFSTDASGNFFNGAVWNTRGGDTAVDIWVAETNLHGPFLNGPGDAQAGISIPLTAGEHTFNILASTGGFTPNHGLNLFFNSNNVTPRISVFGPTQTSNTPPTFAVNGSPSTLTLAFGPVAAANSLVFLNANYRIELTDYRWARPQVYNVDEVSQTMITPDGVADWVGQFTLVVSEVAPEPPVISDQPDSQAVAAGSTVTLGVTATGSQPLTYQWRLDGNDIQGANAASLILQNVQTTQAGSYSVVVANAGGSVTSADAILTVTNPPPATGIILSGLVEFSTDASGSFNNGSVWNTRGGDTAVDLWVVRGADINGPFVNGPSDSQARISAPLVLGENTFTLLASSGFGMPYNGLNLFFNSNDVNPRISVFAPIQSSNTPPSFEANAAASTLTLAFQPVAGASSLVFLNGELQVELIDYRWAAPALNNVDRVAQRSTSTDGIPDFVGQFTLRVTQITAVPPSIETQPSSQTVLSGGPVTFSVAVSGSHPFTYQWRFNGADIVGAVDSSLTLQNINTSHAGAYSVVVANAAGSVTSDDAVLTVTPTTGIILSGLVEFSTDASGSFNNGSVWNTRGGDTAVNLWVVSGGNVNGPFVNGPSDSQARISVPLLLGENTFTLMSSTGGFTPHHALNLFFNSNNVTPRISVFGPTQTSNTPPTFAVNGSPSTLTLAFGPVAAANSLVYSYGDLQIELTSYRWASPEVHNIDRVAQVSTTPDSILDFVGQFTLNVTQGTPVAPSIATQPSSQSVISGGSATFSVTASGSEPFTYQWRFNGADLPGATASSLALQNVDASNAGAYSVIVGNAAGSVTSADAILTVTPSTGIVLSGLVEFSTDGSGNFDNHSIWNTRSGDTAVDLWVVQGSDRHGTFLNGPSDAQAGISLPLAFGENTFTILSSSGFSMSFHGLNLFFNSNNITPAISVFGPTQTDTNPPNFFANGSASTLTLAFQPVAGANTLVFMDGDLQIELIDYRWAAPALNNSDQVSQYSTSPDSVPDFVGHFTLNVTRLTNAPPAIRVQPASQTVFESSNVTFSVTVTGSHPLSYQWRFNGDDIEGATAASLTLSNVQSTAAGNYSVVVSNPFGTATSSDAVLTVTDRPHLTATVLSGLVEFSTDDSGNFFNGSVWNTRGGDSAVDLWVLGGTNVQGPFVNGPADAQAGISLALAEGENHFVIFGNQGGFTPHHGLNLFFNGNTEIPGISVFGETQLSASAIPAFTSNGSPNTLTLAFESIAGANTLVYEDERSRVELTAYRWATFGVYGIDRVSQRSTSPDGGPDFIGGFTLTVTSKANGSAPVAVVSSDQTPRMVIAGADGTADVILDGTHSSDPENDPLSFAWYAADVATPFSTEPTTVSSAPLGEHRVTLIVSDGQAASRAYFAFEVISPSEAVAAITELLEGANLERKNASSLQSALRAAVKALEQGHPAVAANLLTVFQKKVQGQMALSNPVLHRALTSAAQRVIDALDSSPGL